LVDSLEEAEYEVFHQKPEPNLCRFIKCRFENITCNSGGTCGIIVNSVFVSVEVGACIFDYLIYEGFDIGAACIFAKDCKSIHLILSCFYFCRHPVQSQSFGLNSNGFDCRSSEVNLSVVDEGNNPHRSGLSTCPFYAGGLEQFIFQGNNITSDKECNYWIIVTFNRCNSPGVPVIFSQFSVCRGQYLLEFSFAAENTKCSLCNFVNLDITDGLFCEYNPMEKPLINECIFIGINLARSGNGKYEFISCLLSLSESQIPLECTCRDCVFDFHGPTKKLPVPKLNGKCAFHSNEFTAPKPIGDLELWNCFLVAFLY